VEESNPKVKLEQLADCVIPWSPPQPNWNTWAASNIDEGYLAYASLEQLSEDLLKNAQERKINDNCLIVCG